MESNTTDMDHVSVDGQSKNSLADVWIGIASRDEVFRQRPLAFPDFSSMPLMIKRFGDIICSLLLLAVFAVPMLIIAVLVKLTSKGPMIYQQTRVSKHGREFQLYKFRSMQTDSEEKSGPIWASKNDVRSTDFGKLLRRYSFDELPQLINVIRGEMSLVGPRPERPHFVNKFSEEHPDYNLRHRVLPGLTGWAQVSGWRGDTSLRDRLNCDLEYINTWSLKNDLYICLMTPLEIMRGERSGR